MNEPKIISEPKISFVMPVYNAVAWIGEALQSLLTQTVKEIEIIVIDDCSTDGTKEFLDEWASQFPEVRIIHNEKNLGAGMSRNLGAELAKAPLIGICDADDINADERAALILKHFELNPESELVNFPHIAVGYFNEQIEEFPGAPFDYEEYKKTGRLNYFSNPTVAVKKESLLAVGGYGRETVNEDKDRLTDDAIFLKKWIDSGRKVDFQMGYCVVFHRNLPDSMMTKVRGWDPAWVRPK